MVKSLVNSFDPTVNFWVLNPHLVKLGYFKELHTNDKSKEKDKSSKIMIFVCYFYDLTSPLINLPEADRIQTICEDIVEDKDYYKNNQKDILEAGKFYKDLQDTPAIRQLRVWNKKMEEKNLFMENTPYAEDTWEMLDKMMLNNANAYKSYTQIQEQIMKSGDDSHTKGGQEPTLSDQGII